MAFFIKNNSSGSWYTIDGKATVHYGGNTIESVRHGYSSESEANSAISSLSLTNVTVVEE